MQIVLPPATRGGVVLAVRKHVISDMSLEDLAEAGERRALPQHPQPDDPAGGREPAEKRGERAGRPGAHLRRA